MPAILGGDDVPMVMGSANISTEGAARARRTEAAASTHIRHTRSSADVRRQRADDGMPDVGEMVNDARKQQTCSTTIHQHGAQETSTHAMRSMTLPSQICVRTHASSSCALQLHVC